MGSCLQKFLCIRLIDTVGFLWFVFSKLCIVKAFRLLTAVIKVITPGTGLSTILW